MVSARKHRFRNVSRRRLAAAEKTGSGDTTPGGRRFPRMEQSALEPRGTDIGRWAFVAPPDPSHEPVHTACRSIRARTRRARPVVHRSWSLVAYEFGTFRRSSDRAGRLALRSQEPTEHPKEIVERIDRALPGRQITRRDVRRSYTTLPTSLPYPVPPVRAALPLELCANRRGTHRRPRVSIL